VMLDRGYITRRRTMLVDHRAMMEWWPSGGSRSI
jgi:hypothetical protein